MDVAALVLWMITAGVGLYLLMATIAVKRAHTPSLAVPGGEGTATGTAAPAIGGTLAAGSGTIAAGTGTIAAGTGTIAGSAGRGGDPLTPGSGQALLVPPPIPRVRVVAGPDDHPLMEFSHPAVAITGLALWIAFVATRDPGFAWVASGMLLLTIAAGIAWLLRNVRAGQRRHGGRRSGPGVPSHLILLHGVAATCTFLLALVSMLAITHV